MEALVDERRKLLQTYFNVWRRVSEVRKEKIRDVALILQQKEKLNNLVHAIKVFQKHKDQEAQFEDKMTRTEKNSFKNRFEAQKDAIQKLTLQLQEKNRLIEDLKLGVLDKEAMSLNETKIKISEIFASCSKRVRQQHPPPLEYNEKFMVLTQKAPKIIQEMEEKALERAKRRESILERKRILEEEKRKMVQEALEKKRVQDEDEKKKNLEMMKERRRKELEMRQKLEEKRKIYMEKMETVVIFHNKLLLRKGFQGLLENKLVTEENYQKSVVFCKIKLMTKMLKQWNEVIEEKYTEKNKLADAVYAKNILARAFDSWKNFRLEGMRSKQVAEDYYDLYLLNKIFVCWHRYVCMQLIMEEKKMRKAREHYMKHLTFNAFYQWRTLPAVKELEKAREMKLKKWRQKVWEILPNYKPPNDEYAYYY